MTGKEIKRLNELLEKKAAEEKSDADFFKQVRKRRNEVMRELGITENETPAKDWFNEYNELKQLCERLMMVMDREYTDDVFRQYVEWREQKKSEQAETTQ